MSKRVIQPNAAQLQTLKILRRRLGENGYLIFAVAPWYRRHESDFVAMPKEAPRQFSVVRATATNTVVVRPFADPRGKLYRILPDIRKKSPASIKRGLPPLKSSRQRPDWWLQYIEPEAITELKRLNCLP